MKRLNGKVAIVTGSSSGIGKAIALRFAQEGAMVVVAARRLYKCEETVAQIEAAGGTALPLQTDVADESQVERLIGEICCRAAFAQMKKQGGGTILNMSSVAGVQAWSGTGTYSASKHAIMALSKALADEGRAHRIKVSAICPGGVADDLVDASAGERAGSEKIDPFDIAETALYLACLAPQSAVHQIVVDRMGADW